VQRNTKGTNAITAFIESSQSHYWCNARRYYTVGPIKKVNKKVVQIIAKKQSRQYK